MEVLKTSSDTLFIMLGAVMVLAMHAGFAFLELGTVRTKNQVNALVKILCGAVVISVLAVTAWVGLVGAAVFWLVEAKDVSVSLALLIAAVLNLVVAGGVAFWVKGQLPELIFSATLRQLRATAGNED